MHHFLNWGYPSGGKRFFTSFKSLNLGKTKIIGNSTLIDGHIILMIKWVHVNIIENELLMTVIKYLK